MKLLIVIFVFFLFSHCSKPKTVLICGDHVCVNKAEAEQFFEDNLSIEVKIIKRKADRQTDLIELNLNDNVSGNREVKAFKKKVTNKKLKNLSKDEIKDIKRNVKKQNQKKQIAKKTIKKNEYKKERKVKNNVDKGQKEIVDVCTIIKKCNIEEITKYLINEGKNRKFPDITER